MAEFRMPSLGADMDAGTLTVWRVKPGDKVKRGDIIAEVETAKGVIEIEVFEEGVIDEILVQPGIPVPVGHVLATICSESEYSAVKKPVLTTEVTSIPGPAGQAAPVQPAAPAAVPLAAAPLAGRARVSPLARRVADDLRVDINMITGSGPDGAITRADVEKFAQAQKAAPAPAAPPTPKPVAQAVQPPPLKPAAETPKSAPIPPPAAPEVPVEKKAPVDFQLAMRQAIAAAMSRSNRDIPHYYLETHIDMSKPLRWLEEENAKRSIKDRLLPVLLLLKATAQALVDVPELNGFWVDDHLQTSEAINIGFAIALRTGGLITPAIHNVDMKTLDELREAVSDLIMRTRAGKLRSSEMTDSTIVVTSLGDRGVEKVFGVIYPPQVALVGFGKVVDQPWVENGMIGIRPVLIATLAGDHRATDGHRGGIFLEALNKHLQEVENL